MARNAITIVQRNFAVRLAMWQEGTEEPPDPLEISELCGLMRAAVAALDVSTKIRGDSLGVEQLVDTLIEERNQRN